MEQRWRSQLHLCAKVFAVGAVILFVATMLLGQGTEVSVPVLLAAVAFALIVAAVDGITTKTRDRN